jgi:hypothetical protein
MTNRIMGDATTLANIPLTVAIVGVYRNGRYMADPNALNQRFPLSRYVHVWIDVDGSCPGSAQVLDVERFDATPEQAPAWVKARRKVVHTSLPTLYCDRSTLPAVLAECAAEGLIAGEHYQLWIATLDNSTEWNGRELRTIPGVVAVQLETVGGAWDRSVVYEPRWHPLAA